MSKVATVDNLAKAKVAKVKKVAKVEKWIKLPKLSQRPSWPMPK